MKLEASADAAHALHSDLRGHCGLIIGLGAIGSAPIYTSSKKAPSASTSSTYTEMQGLYLATVEIVWFRTLLSELGFPQEMPSLVDQDNTSTITIATRGPGWGGASKMFKLKYFYVSEQIQEKVINLRYVNTKQIIADGLSKPCAINEFEKWSTFVLGEQ